VKRVLAVLLWCAVVSRAFAQSPQPYSPFVWDENWTYLSDRSKVIDWTDQLHYIPVGSDPYTYLSIGGQIRERGEYIDYPGWGRKNSDNGYFLQRYLLNADWHISPRFRVFAQLDSSLEGGRDGGPRPGIDRSTLNLNQAFADLFIWGNAEGSDSTLSIRAGRQLVSLGSTRLFAIGAGLNVEQPFDGARVTLRASAWSVDLLALRPTLIKSGYFQSEPNPQKETWAVYATHNLPVLPKIGIDLYYVGFDNKSAQWAQGVGREQRQSIGARLFANTPTWFYDAEYTRQFGRFGSGSIRAWAAGYHVGYQLAQTSWKPRAEIDGGLTSGDHNLHDNTLGTFNALFPNGSYLSESLLIGPYNLIMVRPKLEFQPTRRLTLKPNLEFLWRQSTEDGIYNIAGFLTHPGNMSDARYIGSQIQMGAEYSFDRHLTGGFVYEHFFPGKFLEQNPPNRPVNFVSVQLTHNF
jgi:hypothetical protein